jgi:hypothetical protein
MTLFVQMAPPFVRRNAARRPLMQPRWMLHRNNL